MNNSEQVEPRDGADQDRPGDEPAVDLPSATIIGTNIAGFNTAPFPGGIVAPAATLAANEASNEDGDVLNLDALEQFGSGRRQTGDDGVSSQQRELEADELNG